MLTMKYLMKNSLKTNKLNFNKFPAKAFNCRDHHDHNDHHHHHHRATIRQAAPNFSGMAYWNGEFKKISLHDFKGKWVTLFFYPLDHTFVCPTEIIMFNDLAAKFHEISTFIN